MPKSTFCLRSVHRGGKADLLGRASCGARRLMFFCSIACCLALTLLRPPSAQANPQAIDESQLPDAAGVVAAYTSARAWVDGFTAPQQDSPAAKQPISQCAGVCIMLRKSGKLLGTGIDTTPDELMVQRAIKQALSEVLTDATVRRMLSDADERNFNKDQQRREKNETPSVPPLVPPPGAVEHESLDLLHRQIGRGLTIEFEAAGKLSPLIGASLSQLARKLEPGLDGVALRVGKSWTFLFPSRLRATNAGSDPERMLLNLVLGAGLSLKEIPTLAQRTDVGFYSFRTITLAQTRLQQAPLQTFRGDTLVSPSDLTPERLMTLAEGIALHMLESMWPEPAIAEGAPAPGVRQPVGMLGDYSPISDDYRPLIAPPLDQALAAFALKRFAKVPGVNTDLAGRTAAASLRVLQDLSEIAPSEVDPASDPLACAAIIYAVAEVPTLRQDVLIGPLFESARQTIWKSYSTAGGFIDRSHPDGKGRLISTHGQALLAGSMARLILMKDDLFTAATVRNALDSVWKASPQPQQIGLLPWIGWAESDFAQATGQPLAHSDDLRLLAELLSDIQIRGTTSADLAGGFPLQDSGSGQSSGSATSQSLRPLAWLCGVSSDPMLAGVLRDPEKLQTNATLGARFLLQLTARTALEGNFPNFKRAEGGVRQSLWQSEQPVAAQCLGLIAASELLQAGDKPGN